MTGDERKQERLSERERQIEECFAHTIRQNGILVFEVDKRTRRIVRMDGFTREFMQSNPDCMDTEVVSLFCEKTKPVPSIYPEDQKKFRELFDSAFHGADNVSMEARVYFGDGKKYLWSFLTISRLGESTSDRGLLCTCRVIHAQKMMELKYQEELKIREQINTDTIMTSVVNLSGNYVENILVNGRSIMEPEYYTMTDYRTRLGILLKDLCLSDRENEKFLPKNLLEKYQTGTDHYTTDFLAVRKSDNREIWLHTECSIIIQPESHDVLAVFYHQNHMEQYIGRQLMQSVLEEDYEVAGLIFANSGNVRLYDKTGNAVKNREYKGSFWAAFVENLFYGSTSKYSKERTEKLLKENSVPYIMAKLKKHTVYVTTAEIVSENNEIRKKELRYVYSDKQSGVICVYISDITDIVIEEMKRQEELERALEMAEQANMSKSEFLATMSHEIRTPMNVILGMTRLTEEAAEDPQMVRDYLSKINVASRHLLNLINNILDMSKIEKGEFELHPEAYTYAEFEQYLDAVVRPLCQEKQIRLVECENCEHHTIWVDKLRFNQVMFNILSNAVKFTPEGGSIYYRYDNHIADGVLSANWEIKDTGIGMTEEFQKRLYEPFTQENNGIVRAVQGTGLGLSLAKGIIDKMGGTIRCVSKKGEGTTFYIHFDFLLTNEKSYAEKVKKQEDISFVGKRILLVEDHPMNRMIAEKLLENKGAEVLLAENGKEAVDCFLESPVNSIDAVLMDVRMPVMDGLEATKEIRKLEREDASKVPVIAMTANAYDSDREKSMEAGMDYHLSKPIEPRRLYEVLERFMRTHQ